MKDKKRCTAKHPVRMLLVCRKVKGHKGPHDWCVHIDGPRDSAGNEYVTR